MNLGLSTLADNIPRARIAGILSRLKDGQRLRIAVLSEGLDRMDRMRLLDLAEQIGDAATPAFVASVIETLYERDASRPAEPTVVWTGPRVEVPCDYTPTIVAARRIIDGSRRRIIIAGYQVTALTLENLGAWSAIERGVTVDAIMNDKDVVETDYQVIVAKGVRVHRAASTARNFAKFHVKALIGDGASCLIGSANFTSLGQTSNIELGLYVVGPVASMLECMLDQYLVTARSTGWIITS